MQDPALADLRTELMQFDTGPPSALAEGSSAAEFGMPAVFLGYAVDH